MNPVEIPTTAVHAVHARDDVLAHRLVRRVDLRLVDEAGRLGHAIVDDPRARGSAVVAHDYARALTTRGHLGVILGAERRRTVGVRMRDDPLRVAHRDRARVAHAQDARTGVEPKERDHALRRQRQLRHHFRGRGALGHDHVLARAQLGDQVRVLDRKHAAASLPRYLRRHRDLGGPGRHLGRVELRRGEVTPSSADDVAPSTSLNALERRVRVGPG